MYRVHVESIGDIDLDDPKNRESARQTFEAFKDMSKSDFGQVSGKNVYFYNGNDLIDSLEQ